MKSNDILNAIGFVDEGFVEKSIPSVKKKSKKVIVLKTVAAVLAVILVLNVFARIISYDPSENVYPQYNPKYPLTLYVSPMAIAVPEYPETAKFGESDYYESRREHYGQYEGYSDGLDGFFQKSTVQILSSKEAKNRVYSPVSLYLALGMLAETTDGNSRKQILELLGYNSIEELRTQAHAVWNLNFCDDGLSKSLLASSMWLDNDLPYNEDTLKNLADNYYSSSFSGEMGSDEYNKALRDWLNHNTGNLLTDYADTSAFDPETVLGLFTTVYFEAQWSSPFSEESNTTEVFHAQQDDIEHEFMNKTCQDRYYWADNFSAARLYFSESGSMWFFLPDENVSVDEVLNNEEMFAIISEPYEYENGKYTKINFSVPKFDVSSEAELSEHIKALGITDVFDMEKADFSILSSDNSEIYLSRANQNSRVKIDETGCVAASYTELMLNAGSGPPKDEEIDFTLDRPFIFVITGYSGMPLFVGVVETP